LKKILLAICLTAASSQAFSATFTPKFSDYPFTGTQFNVDAAANAFYSSNYGITLENAYLYKDSRDTFDGIGVANGLLQSNNIANQTAKINFIDLTNFVTVDYLAILGTTYNAYDTSGALLASIVQNAGTGTFNFNGGSSLIAYITFTSDGGFGTVSSLTYNYDGITGGGNTDLNPVPVPAALPLMASAVGLFGFGLKRRKTLKA
jgi:hypothetical protein